MQSALSAHYPCEIQIHILNNEFFKDTPVWGEQKNHLAYYRLLLGEVLPKDLKRCLYLDVDMLALCDIRELFTIDLKDKIAGVVLGSKNLNNQSLKLKNSDKTIDIGLDGFYFNSGLMFINLMEWHLQNIQNKALENILKFNLSLPDQDALNLAFGYRKNVIILPFYWNVFANFLDLNFNKARRLGYTLKEFDEALKKIKIFHFNIPMKPWLNTPLSAKEPNLVQTYIKLWWDMALQTPIFDKELLLLKTEVQDRFLRDLINQKESEINNKLNAQKAEYETKLAAQRQEQLNFINQAKFELLSLLEPRLTSAVVRVKSQLSYKLGSAIIENSKSFGRNLTLPFALFKIYLSHKKEVRIYKERVFYNPNLKLPLLESYADFNEALKVKDHLSYKLGQAFLKGLKTWYKFGLLKFYFEAKRLEREFKKKSKI